MLTDEQISQFQVLYKARFGKEISRADAYDQGMRLVRLMTLIYRPMTKEEYEQVQQRRKETTNI